MKSPGVIGSLCTLALLAAISWAGESPVKVPEADTVLNTLVKEHPRLILTDKRLEELKALMASDSFLKDKIYADSIAKADEILGEPPLEYKKIGPRLLAVSRQCLRRTYALALAYRLTKDEKYALKAKENLLAVCNFQDWNPSHFLDTAEMTHAVAIGYDWLFPWLDAETKDTLKKAIVEKGMKPGYKEYGIPEGKPVGWVNVAFNWNQVCNMGLSIGALAIADVEPEYAKKIIPLAVSKLPKAIATYGPDGAWPEGPGYWSYATNYTVYGMAAMTTALGTDFGLSEIQGFADAPYFVIHGAGPSNLFYSYADAGEGKRTTMPIFYWFAQRFDKPVFHKHETEWITAGKADPADFIFYNHPSEKIRAAEILPPDKLFKGIVEVAYLRSTWSDPNAIYIGFKAGFNQVNHGHLDLGSFIFDALGERWARDLGSDDYNLPGYWEMKKDGKRWNYYRLNSFSHNLCVLNNQNQDVFGKAKFTKFEAQSDSALGIVDLTTAYIGVARKATRGIQLLPGRKAAVVQDEFSIPDDKPCDLAWGMTTDAKISITGKMAKLTLNDKELKLHILSPEGAVFSEESAEQEPPQKPNKGIKRLMIRLKDQKGSVRVSVIFAPTWEEGKEITLPEVKPLENW